MLVFWHPPPRGQPSLARFRCVLGCLRFSLERGKETRRRRFLETIGGHRLATVMLKVCVMGLRPFSYLIRSLTTVPNV